MIPGQPSMDMTATNDILFSILSTLERQEEERGVEKEDIWQAAYPNDGTKGTLATGVTTLDYDAGTVMSPSDVVTAMSSSLRKQGKSFMQAVALRTSAAVILQFDGHDKFPLDANEWFQADNMEFNKLRITAAASTTCIVLASTA